MNTSTIKYFLNTLKTIQYCSLSILIISVVTSLSHAASTKEYIANSNDLIAHAIIRIDRSRLPARLTGEIQLIAPVYEPNTLDPIRMYLFRIGGNRLKDLEYFEIWKDDLIHNQIADPKLFPNANIEFTKDGFEYIPVHANGKRYHFVRYIPGPSTKTWLSQVQTKVTQWQREQQKQRKAAPKPKSTDKPVTER